MQIITFGELHIVVAHISHFTYSPSVEDGVTGVPATLTVCLANSAEFIFHDKTAEEGFKRLSGVFTAV